MAALYNIPFVVGLFKDAETIFTSKRFTAEQKHFMLTELQNHLHPMLSSCPTITSNIKEGVDELIKLVNYQPPLKVDEPQPNAEASA